MKTLILTLAAVLGLAAGGSLVTAAHAATPSYGHGTHLYAPSEANG